MNKKTKTNKVVVRKLNVPRIIVILLIIYVLAYACYYVYSSPVHHYEISGNTYISDADILREASLEDYPSFLTLNFKKTEKKIESLDYVKKAKLSYGWNFTIKITIEENKPVFIIRSTDKIVLSDGTQIDNDGSVVGIPTLLNDTPQEQLKTLATNLNNVDDGTIYTINEIMYSPSYNSQQKIIDENRFLLFMNDSNTVYITAKKADILNNYLDVIATNEIKGNGTFYLDGDEERYSYIERNPSAKPPKEKEEAPAEPGVDDGVAVQEAGDGHEN